MKSICLVNGSLRGKKASSLRFLEDLYDRLNDVEYHKTKLTVRARLKGSYPPDVLQMISDADATIFVFPLYNYGLPGAVMRLLEDYYSFVKGCATHKKGRVYAVVNCAFPRPDKTSMEAIRVMKNFCKRCDLDWRLAICIGTGPVVAMTRRVPFLDLKLKRAYSQVVSDIRDESAGVQDCFVRPVLPEIVIRKIKESYEKRGHMIERGRRKVDAGSKAPGDGTPPAMRP